MGSRAIKCLRLRSARFGDDDYALNAQRLDLRRRKTCGLQYRDGVLARLCELP